MVFPFQVIHASADPFFESTDLSGLSDTDQDSALAELYRVEQFRESVPDQSPTLVAKLLTLGPARSALLLSLPTMAADSRSLRILAREILQFSGDANAEADGEPLRYVRFSYYVDSNIEQRRAFPLGLPGCIPFLGHHIATKKWAPAGARRRRRRMTTKLNYFFASAISRTICAEVPGS
jgi:hypothetical protein